MNFIVGFVQSKLSSILLKIQDAHYIFSTYKFNNNWRIIKAIYIKPSVNFD